MNSPGFVKLNQNKAKKLAGVDWVIDGACFRFKPRDPNRGGHQPWTTGTEAIAFPLLNTENEVVAYLKGFKKPTQRRFDRTHLLAELNLSAAAATLMAAPTRWLDTRSDGRPRAKEIDFDFCGSLMPAVPGKTWSEIKKDICARRVKLSPEFRLRCIKDLLLSLAILEQINFIHGDLSPSNIIINTDADPDKPALYLIDFDAFVYECSLGEISFVPQSEGGTFGTPGYFPPELELKGDLDPTKHPFSDRFGRDMLITELLAFGATMDHEQAPREWDQVRLQRRLQATIKQFETSANVSQLVEPLMADDVFCCSEDARPTSESIASQLGFEHLIPVVPSVPLIKPARSESPVWEPPTNGKKETSSRRSGGVRGAFIPVTVKSDSSSIPSKVTPPRSHLTFAFIGVCVLLMAVFIGGRVSNWEIPSTQPPIPPNHPPDLQLVGDLQRTVDSESKVSIKYEVIDPDGDDTWIIMKSETPFQLANKNEPSRTEWEIWGNTPIEILIPKSTKPKANLSISLWASDEHGAESEMQEIVLDVVPAEWPCPVLITTIKAKVSQEEILSFSIEVNSIENSTRIFLQAGVFELDPQSRRAKKGNSEITNRIKNEQRFSLQAPSSLGPYEISIYAVNEHGHPSLPETKIITVVKTIPPPNHPPVLTIHSPKMMEARVGDLETRIRYSVRDPDGDKVQAIYFDKKTPEKMFRGKWIQEESESNKRDIPIQTTVAGNFEIIVYARDEHGEVSEKKRISINVRQPTKRETPREPRFPPRDRPFK
jgi:serine/threonine protein kinase